MDFLTCLALGKLPAELLEVLDELIKLELLELNKLERLDDRLDKLFEVATLLIEDTETELDKLELDKELETPDKLDDEESIRL
jgi:hypothetical protein